MLVVAGLSLKNLHPRVWDVASPYYLPELRAVMVSYGEFHRMPQQRRSAMEKGLHAYLGAPLEIAVYLDNGAFSFLRAGGEVPRADYERFVAAARPDWYAIPQDYIPTPNMTDDEQRACLDRTMAMNRAYRHDGYVPVVHVSRRLDEYLAALQADELLRTKRAIGVGAIVPNLLRAPRAMPYEDVLAKVRPRPGWIRLDRRSAFDDRGEASGEELTSLSDSLPGAGREDAGVGAVAERAIP